MPRLFALVAVLLALVLVGPAALAQDATPGGEMAGEEAIIFAPLAAAPLAGDLTAPAAVALARVRIEPGAAEPAPTASPDLLLVYVERGAVTLETEGTVAVMRASSGATPGPVEEVAAGEETTLESGDGFAIPAGVPTRARNDGDEPVAALLAFVGAATEGAPATPGAGTPAAAEEEAAPGFAFEFLAFGVAESLPAGPLEATLALQIFAPGGGFPAGESAGPLLVHLEAGSAIYTLESGDSLVTRAVDGAAAPDAGQAEAVAPGTETTINAGDSWFEQGGAVSGGRNAGDEPAVHLVVFLWPAGFFAPPPAGTPGAATPAP